MNYNIKRKLDSIHNLHHQLGKLQRERYPKAYGMGSFRTDDEIIMLALIQHEATLEKSIMELEKDHHWHDGLQN